MAVEIKKQDDTLSLELCELQTNLFLFTKEIHECFWKKLPVEKYTLLRCFNDFLFLR